MTNWTIANLEHNVADGGVIVAHWRCTAEEVVGEETYSASAYGTVGFTPDATAAGYIAYADLTEADVLGWVYESVDKAETEANLAAQIEAQKNPVAIDGVPW
jgi:hypothetical protein